MTITNKFFGKTIIEDKEEELKDISKSALVHNIVIEKDAKDEIIKERDEIYEENERLHKQVEFLSKKCREAGLIKDNFKFVLERELELNKNLQTIIDRMNEDIKRLKEQK